MRLFLSIMLIALGAGLFYFQTNPLLLQINLDKAELASRELVVNNGRKLIQVRDERKKELVEFPVETRARLEKMVPNRIDNVRLIIDLIALARKSQMELQDPKISAGSAAGASVGPNTKKFDSAEMEFTVESTFPQFQRFLEALEQNLRLLDIVSVSFTAQDDDIYKYTVRVRTYWLKN